MENLSEEKRASFKGLTGSWSKYGGKRQRITYNQHGLASAKEIWSCQSCGHQQPPALSPVLYEFPLGEYIRICGICFREDCGELRRRIDGSY